MEGGVLAGSVNGTYEEYYVSRASIFMILTSLVPNMWLAPAMGHLHSLRPWGTSSSGRAGGHGVGLKAQRDKSTGRDGRSSSRLLALAVAIDTIPGGPGQGSQQGGRHGKTRVPPHCPSHGTPPEAPVHSSGQIYSPRVQPWSMAVGPAAGDFILD